MGKRVISLAVALVLALGFAAGYVFLVPFAFEKETKFDYLPGEKPYFRGEPDKLELTMPNEDNAQEVKNFAYDLYKTANAKLKAVPDAAMLVSCLTDTKPAGIEVLQALDYRYTVKNADKYFYAEYSFVGKGGEGLVDLFGAAASTKFAVMRYTDKTMENMYERRILNPAPTKKEVDGKNIYNVDWHTNKIEKELTKPVYYAEQEEEFFVTEQNILPETITSARVSYDEEKEYYTIVLELDVTNPLTTEITLPNLRAGFGNDTANYTSLTQTIEIWDNGYFRRFLAEDKWEGVSDIGISLKTIFDINFETFFYYDKESVNISNYQYADMLIAEIKA